MKHTVPVAMLLFVFARPALMAGTKPGPVDIRNMNKVFIGWIDLNPEDYYKLGYSTKDEWVGIINGAVTNFQENLAASGAFAGKNVIRAKDRTDENTTGDDLYVKFSDAKFDPKYRLSIAVHLIDLRTNSEIGSVPSNSYGAHLCTLSGCLDKELQNVNRKIQKLVATGK